MGLAGPKAMDPDRPCEAAKETGAAQSEMAKKEGRT